MIQNLIPKIKNYYRITEEYALLADFLVRKIRESILPYFSQFRNSKDILNCPVQFKLDNLSEMTERNENLILYCELANNIDVVSSKILNEHLSKLKKIDASLPKIKEYESTLNLILEKNWNRIDEILADNKQKILKKLKIK